MTDSRIGFVGTGRMGAPMVGHLAAEGRRLTLYDIDADAARRAAEAIGEGAEVAATPAEVAAASDVIFTMLPNGETVREAVQGPDGMLSTIREGALLVDTSSAEPWLTLETAEALAGKGAAMLDAPVSGAVWGAEAGELVFMVGGAEDDVARARPLLDAMGRAVFHLGPLGAGHAMKCLNNTITSVILAATTEGLVAGQKYGLDPAAMVDVLNESTGGSWVSQTHFHKRIFNRAFDDPFQLALMLKDVNIAMDLTRAQEAPAPLFALTQQVFRMASREAGPGASVSELVRWIERQAGTELKG